MKINTNFVDPVQQRIQTLLWLGWLLAAGLGVLGAWLVHDARDLRAALPALRAQAQRSEKAARPAAVPDWPSERELARTRERVARLNALAQTDGLASAQLFGELEALLPPQAWLTLVHYRATQGEVRLLAAAPSAEPLSAFLNQLERSALFEQSLLLREIPPTGAGRSAVQFE
ncbi:MAG: PilN domain-containing protein, partial [Hylemonella sp.]|nr:PilN domain-containing protein [Hylemonella sp.]